jgi:hypothetical protein
MADVGLTCQYTLTSKLIAELSRKVLWSSIKEKMKESDV